MARRQFPLDNAFDLLRAEVEKTQAAFAGFRASLGGGGAGGVPTVNVGRAPFEGAGSGRDDRRRFVELARFGKEATKSIQELGRAAKGVGSIAKTLGFDSAAADLEKASVAFDRAHTALEGLGAVAKVAALAFKPLVVAVGALGLAFAPVIAGAAAFQQAIKGATGATLSLGNAAKVAGLGLVRGIGSAIAFVVERVPLIETAFRLLPDAIRQVMASLAEAVVRKFGDLTSGLGALLAKLPERFRPDGIIAGLNEVGTSAAGLAEGLRAVISEGDAAGKAALAAAKQRGAAIRAEADALKAGLDATVSEIFSEEQGTDIFADPMKALGEFMQAIKDGIPDAAKEAAEKAANALGKALTEKPPEGGGGPPAQEAFRSAGMEGGAEYASGVQEALASVQLDQAIVDALTVDPDDETKVINSVNDLIKNVKRLFDDNPLGFIFGALGLGGGGMGGAGGGGAVGFARGGLVGSGGRPSWAHAFAGGLAGGGFPRPPGLHPTDTIPAWLAKDEFVEPRPSVQYYGVPFMESLRTLSIPREPLLALADGFAGGVPRTVSAPAPRSGPQGYAGGGLVSAGGGGESSTGPVVAPVIVADGPTFGRMLAGGNNEMKRWLRDNGYGPGRS